MPFEAQAMAGAMGEIRAIAGRCDDAARRRIDVHGGDAGTRRGAGCLDCGFNHGVDFPIFLARLADKRHAGQIAGKGAGTRADIHDDGVADRHRLIACRVMREGAIAAGADDGEERRCTGFFEHGAGRVSDLALGDSRPDRREGGLHGAVIDLRIAQDLGLLGLILRKAHAADAFGREAGLRLAERIDDEQREIGAHGLVHLHELGVLLDPERPDERGKRRLRARGVGPGEEGQIGLPAHFVCVQLGHQHRGAIGRRDQQARPLIGMRVDIGDVSHVRPRSESHDIDAILAEHGLKGRKSGHHRLPHEFHYW